FLNSIFRKRAVPHDPDGKFVGDMAVTVIQLGQGRLVVTAHPREQNLVTKTLEDAFDRPRLRGNLSTPIFRFADRPPNAHACTRSHQGLSLRPRQTSERQTPLPSSRRAFRPPRPPRSATKD